MSTETSIQVKTEDGLEDLRGRFLTFLIDDTYYGDRKSVV